MKTAKKTAKKFVHVAPSDESKTHEFATHVLWGLFRNKGHFKVILRPV